MFKNFNISIKPKSFIGFLSIRLLSQHINSFGLTTIEDKLQAIADLKFLNTLKDLETYLGMTSWLHDYVPFYAEITEPLQVHKTLLLKYALVKGVLHQKYTLNTRFLSEPY